MNSRSIIYTPSPIPRPSQLIQKSLPSLPSLPMSYSTSPTPKSNQLASPRPNTTHILSHRPTYSHIPSPNASHLPSTTPSQSPSHTPGNTYYLQTLGFIGLIIVWCLRSAIYKRFKKVSVKAHTESDLPHSMYTVAPRFQQQISPTLYNKTNLVRRSASSNGLNSSGDMSPV